MKIFVESNLGWLPRGQNRHPFHIRGLRSAAPTAAMQSTKSAWPYSCETSGGLAMEVGILVATIQRTGQIASTMLNANMTAGGC
jgi:hypothetical protein